MKTGISHDSGSLGRLWLSAVPQHERGFCLCSQFRAITEGCCNITQSSFFTQIVKSSHLERNSVYQALIMHFIEYSSDTNHLIHCVKPSPPRSAIFSTPFCAGKSSFLGQNSQRGVTVQLCRVCTQRWTCPQCIGLNLQKCLKENNRASVSAFIRSWERLS